MSYREAFPDYPPESLPAIPAHWADRSWRNETCPSFQIGEEDGFIVFVDYADPDQREIAEGARFSVHALDQNGHFPLEPYVPLETDDWGQVLAFMALEERIMRLRKDELTQADAIAMLAEEERAPRPCPDMLAYLRAKVRGAE